MSIIKYLKIENSKRLSDTELILLDNMEEEIQNIPNLTITKLSNRIFTSTTSLHRLITKLGFEGYSEFKYTIENYLDNNRSGIFYEIDENPYLKHSLSDLTITYKLNESKFNGVVQDIVSHKDLYCFGTGWKQKQAVDNFANDLLYYGHSLKTLRNIDDLRIASRTLNKDSLVFIVSLSGNLSGYKEIIDLIVENNVTLIAVTQYSENPLATLATHSLQFVDTSLNIHNHHWSSVPLNFILDQLMHEISEYSK